MPNLSVRESSGAKPLLVLSKTTMTVLVMQMLQFRPNRLLETKPANEASFIPQRMKTPTRWSRGYSHKAPTNA